MGSLICPRCGSLDIKKGHLVSDCNRCQHYGPTATFRQGGPNVKWCEPATMPIVAIVGYGHKYGGEKAIAFLSKD